MARMGRPPKNPADKKSVTLTLRLDPRVRFAMEFIGRVTGRNITKVVETAIVKYADGIKSEDKNWRSFWDISEGVRELKFLFHGKFFVTYDEERLKRFIDRHEVFFTVDVTDIDDAANLDRPLGDRLDSDKVDVLWPNIQTYLDLWDETKATDHWAAGKAMQKDLRAAGIRPPTWPLKEPNNDDKQGDIDTDRPDGPADETSS
jgi:hypothetical protein